MITGGLGCRTGCAAEVILRAVEQALAAAGKSLGDLQALYTPEWKRAEGGLAEAAARLGKPLVFLPLEALQAQAPNVLTRSEHVEQHFGLPGVAETAALAGACTPASFAAPAPLIAPAAGGAAPAGSAPLAAAASLASSAAVATLALPASVRAETAKRPLCGAEAPARACPRLLGPRVAVRGATCALAELSAEESVP